MRTIVRALHKLSDGRRPLRPAVAAALLLCVAVTTAQNRPAPAVRPAVKPAAPVEPRRAQFLEMFARAYFPGRNGQIMIVPREGDIITRKEPELDYMHGSPWGYDVEIPMLFAGPAIRPGTYAMPAGQQDVARHDCRVDRRRDAGGVNGPRAAGPQPERRRGRARCCSSSSTGCAATTSIATRRRCRRSRRCAARAPGSRTRGSTTCRRTRPSATPRSRPAPTRACTASPATTCTIASTASAAIRSRAGVPRT